MPLKGLYMVGAATWPGAGTNAVSGYLAAQKIRSTSRPNSSIIRAGFAATLLLFAGACIAQFLRKKKV